MRLFVSFALVASLILCGCTKEQSELTLESITGSAVIKGQVHYNQGIKELNGAIYEEYLVPASGQTVSVEVSYSNYKQGSQGKKTFSAETDENGNYSITIPVGATEISGVVKVEAFVGTYNEMVNGVSYTREDAIYENGNTKSFNSVGQDDEKVVNINIAAKPTFPTETLKRTITIFGEAKVIAEEILLNSYNSFYGLSTQMDDLDNVNLLVELSNPYRDSRTITYKVNVNYGKYKQTLSYYDSWDIDDIRIVVTAQKRSDNFMHYYVRANSTNVPYKQSVSGYYHEASVVNYIRSSASYLSSKEFELTDILVTEFTPDNLDNILGIDYSNRSEYLYFNPMNW